MIVILGLRLDHSGLLQSEIIIFTHVCGGPLLLRIGSDPKCLTTVVFQLAAIKETAVTDFGNRKQFQNNNKIKSITCNLLYIFNPNIPEVTSEREKRNQIPPITAQHKTTSSVTFYILSDNV